MLALRRAGLAAVAIMTASAADSQPRPRQAPTPALSASRSIMAGSMLAVSVSNMPQHARLAIARVDDPATQAILVVELGGRSSASLPSPGEAGAYELRLTQDRDGAPLVLSRQPLATTSPIATLSAPARVARGKPVPVRGIGPNGEQDRVAIVPVGAPPETPGTFFFPHENVEATLDAPMQPGAYEIRYVMNAPVSGRRILAAQTLTVE